MEDVRKLEKSEWGNEKLKKIREPKINLKGASEMNTECETKLLQKLPGRSAFLS